MNLSSYNCCFFIIKGGYLCWSVPRFDSNSRSWRKRGTESARWKRKEYHLCRWWNRCVKRALYALSCLLCVGKFLWLFLFFQHIKQKFVCLVCAPIIFSLTLKVMWPMVTKCEDYIKPMLSLLLCCWCVYIV